MKGRDDVAAPALGARVVGAGTAQHAQWMTQVAPSLERSRGLDIDVVPVAPDGVAVGVPVGPDGDAALELGLDWSALRAVGFEGHVGQTLPLPTPGRPTTVLVGVGDPSRLEPASLRDAAAALARAAGSMEHITTSLTDVAAVEPVLAGRAVVEGVTLARYRFDSLKRQPDVKPVTGITLVARDERADGVAAGARTGRATSQATQLARDLANSPPRLLTAARMAELAEVLGPERGLSVEVFDKDALVDLGCGGLLGVNAGSAEPPRMIKLTYRPQEEAGNGRPAARLTLVGKGIMYDAGGIALKPADEVHATMKNDMSGAGAILAAMLVLAELGCTALVTGYLMCTDNRPSGTALAMGDVITIRGGTSVEVVNTDAEGRLVMADALVLATEEPTDAIVDIATLTGAAMRALGTRVAVVMGNDEHLVDLVVDAAAATDEPVWQLPLQRDYRKELDTPVADLKNLGGPNAGAITAGLFLEEFVGDRSWAHIDMAGTAQSDEDASWRPAGCTGFGARLLIDLALRFRQD